MTAPKIIRDWDAVQAVMKGMSDPQKIVFLIPYETIELYGIPYAKALADKIYKTYESQVSCIWTDCGDNKGAALGGMRAKISPIIFRGEEKAFEKLQMMAKQGSLVIVRNIDTF